MDYSEKSLKSLPGMLYLHKERGETLSVFLDRIVHENSIAGPVTYAGRLDPMAEGLMLVLAGEARFQKDAFLRLEKEYEFEVLFGVSTDTYDVLGQIQDCRLEHPLTESICEALKTVQLKTLPYPPFSSKPVNGKPLFIHARHNTLPEDVPVQPGTISTICLRSVRQLPVRELVESIISDIQKVEGDFRQADCIADWKEYAANNAPLSLTLARCTATVSSGAYIRSIAHEIGKILGIPALAYKITRTRIGTHKARM